MATCSFSGNTDMYGLGIRIGFYLQWFGTILASWVARSEVDGMRLSNSFFVSATFLALVVQTAKDNLQPVEIYIILLLTFGGYYYFVLLYIWRIITGCNPRWDPSRYPRVPTGSIFSALNFVLLIAVTIFQLWFWVDRAKDVGEDGCPEYGFFFAKIRLNERGFEAINILFNIFLLLSCLAILFISVAKWIGAFEEKKHRRVKTIRRMALQEMQTLVNLIIASTVVAATELTIQWNGITGVNDVSSAGQLIPMVIGIGLITLVLYVWLSKDDSNWVGSHTFQVPLAPVNRFQAPGMPPGAVRVDGPAVPSAPVDHFPAPEPPPRATRVDEFVLAKKPARARPRHARRR